MNRPLYQMMHQTTVLHQKKLALAYHLKMLANKPAMSDSMTPLAQEAGKRLAQTKYPLSPAAEMKLQAEAIPEDPDKLSPAEQAQVDASNDESRDCFPNLTPPAIAPFEAPSYRVGLKNFGGKSHQM